MTLSIVGVAKGSTVNVGTTPTGAASGDSLLFHVAVVDNTSVVITPPTGAVLVNRQDHPTAVSDPLTVALYRLALTGTPAASYTFACSGGSGADVTTTCVRGAAATPIDSGAGAPTGADGTNAAPTATGLTTGVASELLLWYWLGDDFFINSPPAGFTAQIDGTSSPSGVSLAGFGYGYYTKVAATSGATGNISAGTAGADDWIVMLAAVVPAGAGPSFVPPEDDFTTANPPTLASTPVVGSASEEWIAATAAAGLDETAAAVAAPTPAIALGAPPAGEDLAQAPTAALDEAAPASNLPQAEGASGARPAAEDLAAPTALDEAPGAVALPSGDAPPRAPSASEDAAYAAGLAEDGGMPQFRSDAPLVPSSAPGEEAPSTTTVRDEAAAPALQPAPSAAPAPALVDEQLVATAAAALDEGPPPPALSTDLAPLPAPSARVEELATAAAPTLGVDDASSPPQLFPELAAGALTTAEDFARPAGLDEGAQAAPAPEAPAFRPGAAAGEESIVSLVAEDGAAVPLASAGPATAATTTAEEALAAPVVGEETSLALALRSEPTWSAGAVSEEAPQFVAPAPIVDEPPGFTATPGEPFWTSAWWTPSTSAEDFPRRAAAAPLLVRVSVAPFLVVQSSIAPLLQITVTPMLATKPGQSVRVSFTLSSLGVLTDAPQDLTVTIAPPRGAQDAPIVDAAPVHDSQGTYHSDQLIPMVATPGLWIVRVHPSGAAVDANALVEYPIRVLALDF